MPQAFLDSKIMGEYDPSTKTAISVRDGVIEYMGSEIGEMPADKIFTVYRSPATIANVAASMNGLLLCDEHIDVDLPVESPVGTIESSDLVDMINPAQESTLAIRNKITFTDSAPQNKYELSLGYLADLVPHHKYDFEQRGIVPKHLAIVESGRCGPACRFIDRKPPEEKTMPKLLQLKKLAAALKAFRDEEAGITVDQIAELAKSLPEALKNAPVDKLQEMWPALMELIEISKAAGVEMPELAAAVEGDKPAADPDKTPAADEDKDKPTDEDKDKVKVTDSKAFKDAVQKASDAAVKRHSEVVEKARGFLDDTYSFAGKNTVAIIRDALATEHGAQKFEDSELDLAFKMLRKTSSQYQQFGDAAAKGSLTERVKAAEQGE
jgi:hypothetical protein